MIEIEALRKSYRKARGLDGFSLHLESNELVGLVGPNGAGKTTLIKILATLLPADSGSVRVSGHDVSADPVAVRASLGYLPDVAGIYQDMRIGEFLEFFADAFRLKEPQRTAARQRPLLAICRRGVSGLAEWQARLRLYLCQCKKRRHQQ